MFGITKDNKNIPLAEEKDNKYVYSSYVPNGLKVGYKDCKK